MTVSELIKMLQTYPAEMQVAIYSYNHEEGGMAYSLQIQDRDNPDNWRYFKGDHPFRYCSTDEIGDSILFIVGE